MWQTERAEMQAEMDRCRGAAADAEQAAEFAGAEREVMKQERDAAVGSPAA